MTVTKSSIEIRNCAWRTRHITILCAALMLTSCQDDGLSAPYSYSGIGSRNLGEAPVTTELHTYDKNFSDEDRFRRFGPPLKLTFPMKFYGYADNLSGGPQLQIALNVDGSTLRAEVDVVRERFAGKSWHDKARAAYGGGIVPNYQFGQYFDGMRVTISSREILSAKNKQPILVRNVSRSVTREKIEREPDIRSRFVGQYCGFDIYNSPLRRGVDGRLMGHAETLNRLVSGEGSFWGIPSEKDATILSIGCDEKPSECYAYLTYREFGVVASVDRSRICKFMPAIRALPQFLDQHAAYPLPPTSWPPPPPPPPSMGGPLINAATD